MSPFNHTKMSPARHFRAPLVGAALAVALGAPSAHAWATRYYKSVFLINCLKTNTPEQCQELWGRLASTDAGMVGLACKLSQDGETIDCDR